MTPSKFHDIVIDIYRELYANSTPKGDFDKLLKEAPMDFNGDKIIPYKEYSIEGSLMDDIVKKYMTRYRMNSLERKSVLAAVYLGCAPMQAVIKHVKNE